MFLAFCEKKGMVYTNYVPRGTSVYRDYNISALRKLLKALHQKLPNMVLVEWVFALGQCSNSHHAEKKIAGVPGQRENSADHCSC
jgi:hypothetical protein